MALHEGKTHTAPLPLSVWYSRHYTLTSQVERAPKRVSIARMSSVRCSIAPLASPTARQQLSSGVRQSTACRCSPCSCPGLPQPPSTLSNCVRASAHRCGRVQCFSVRL